MRLFVLLFFSLNLWAAELNGRLIDGTNEGPGAADVVQLVRLAEGMQIIASIENPSGDFTLTFDGSAESAQLLLQAVKGRAIYSSPVTSLTDTQEVTVFDIADTAAIRASVGTLAVYAYNQNLDIGAFINLDNVSQPPVTLERDDATFTFSLIPGHRDVEASTRRQTMPLRQNLKIEGNQASIDYPLKPGRTQLMVRSHHGYNPGTVNTVRLPLLPEQQNFHLLVMPTTLTVVGEGLTHVSDDDKEGVALYEWERAGDETELVMEISGESADPSKQPAAAASDDHAQGADTSNIKNTPNELHPYRWPIVLSVIAMLGALTLFGLSKN